MLDRFTNNKSLLSSNSPQYGQIFNELDLKIVNIDKLIPKITNVNGIENNLLIETHVYSFSGDLLGSVYDHGFVINPETNSILTNIREVFSTANIKRGSFKICHNFLSPILGRPIATDPENVDWPCYINEISPNRDEVKLTLNNVDNINIIKFKYYVNSLIEKGLLNNLVINFGKNNINKIINVRFDKSNTNIIYLKLFSSINEFINVLNKAWFGIEVTDSYIDTVLLTSEVDLESTNKLKNARFTLDVDQFDSNTTVLKSWDDLLDSNQQTSQQIIDKILNTNERVHLNIDYSNFQNFVFYSSAVERVKIFYSKLEVLEEYNLKISEINSILVQTNDSLNDLEVYTNRINKVKESFDSFERWLYYHSPEPIFTHDFQDVIQPWPKETDVNGYIIVNGEYVNKSITDNESITYYTNILDIATIYDTTNHNALIYAIPEHILMNDSNSNLITFVNMMGHHYDMMYSYINALTKIHERDEHPERGPSNDLLYHIAKSLGWKLQDNNQLSELWLYKMGLDNEGESILSNTNKPIQPHEAQTKQIWRRIINNLPYLLKTKGTSRSIKALMSIYGIPQTLISIKEYGGPGIDFNRPIFTENRFGYKLKLSDPNYSNTYNSSYLSLKQDIKRTWVNGFDTGTHCNLEYDENDSMYVYPLTSEFRFSIKKNDLINNKPQILFSYTLSTDTLNTNTNIPYLVILLYPSEFYNEYINSELGKVKVITFDCNIDNPTYLEKITESESEYIPIFNGDLWTIRINRGQNFDNTETKVPNITYDTNIKGYNSTESIDVLIAKTSDNLYGDINHFQKISINNPINSNLYSLEYAYGKDGLSTHILLGLSSSNNILSILTSNGFNDIQPFLGQVQSYRSYYTYLDEVGNYDNFKQHILNPGLYDTLDNDRGAYYSLYHYFPLGQDLQRWNHDSTGSGSLTIQESFQPDRTLNPSNLIYHDFKGDQTNQYDIINETYYIHVPTLSDSYINNEKIRLEENKLKYNLSVTNKAEESSYDNAGIDNNRLAVVFSIADQVNRDIFNQLGSIDIQSWIGDPYSEFEGEYKDLIFNRREYFQKYTQRVDVNKFIRILSVYDYSFFEQIKQLVPARADLLTGILIEPHILDHSKGILTKRPTVTTPQFKDTIDLRLQKLKGYYDKLDDNIQIPSDLNIKYDYLKGDVELDIDLIYKHNYIKGTIPEKFEISHTSIQNTIKQFDQINVVNKYNGFNGEYFKTIEKNKPDCKFKLKNFQYNPFIYDLGNNSNIKDGWFLKSVLVNDTPTTLSSNWTYTDSIDNLYEFYKMDLRKVFNSFYKERFKWGIELKPNLIVNLGQEFPIDNIIEGKLLVKVSLTSKDSLSNISTNDEIKLLLNIKGEDDASNTLNFYNQPCSIIIRNIESINYLDKFVIPEYLFTYELPNLNNFLGINNRRISITLESNNTVSPVIVFEVQVYNYLDAWQQEYRKMYMRENGLISGYYLTTWHNQIEEKEARNISRYIGTKLKGAGINIDSIKTIDGGPVVEIRKTNPNSIYIKDNDDTGNLKVK